MNNPFIGLEDEIDLRRAVRATYKHEGWVGVYKCIGEMVQSLQIVGEVAQEILDEEKKNQGGNSNV